MSAEGKRQELQNYFLERIFYVFLISKSKGDSDSGLCTFEVLAYRELLSNAKFQNFQWPNAFFSWSRHCTAVLCTQVHKKCTDLNLNFVYNLISGTHGEFTRKFLFLALSVCFPQTCLSVDRRFAASKSCLHYFFVSATMNLMKCLVNWISLRICVRSRNTSGTYWFVNWCL